MKLSTLLNKYKGHTLTEKTIEKMLVEAQELEYGECESYRHPYTFIRGTMTIGCKCHEYKKGDQVVEE